MTMHMPGHISTRDLLLVALVVVSWGFHVPVMKLGVETVAPVSLNVARFFLTALVFLPFAGRISLEDLKKLIPIVVFFVCGNLILAYLSLDYITGNSFVIIIQISQPITMLLAWHFFGERFGWKTAFGIAIAFSGLLIVFGAPDVQSSPLGATLAVLAAVSWAFGSLAMKRTAHIKPATFLGYSYLMGFPVALIATLILEDNQVARFMAADPATITFILAYQVLLMGFMTVVWSGLMSRHQAQYITPFLMLQPVIAVVGDHFMLGETLHWNVAIGGLTVLAGIGFIHWRRIVKSAAHAV